MAKANQKKLNYIANYDINNYERVLIRFAPGTKAAIMATGAKSVNGYVTAAVRDRLEGNNVQAQPQPPQPSTPAIDPQPVQASAPDIAPGYNLTRATLQRINAAVKHGYTDSVAQYVARAVDLQLDRDRDELMAKRERDRAARERAYYIAATELPDE